MNKFLFLLILSIFLNHVAMSQDSQRKNQISSDNSSIDSDKPKVADDNSDSSINLIGSHLSKYFSDDDIVVMHEIVSDSIHIDIYIVMPNKERDYYILVTSGMSSYPMKVPDANKNECYLEIVTLLPSNWQLNSEAFKNEDNYWPIRKLKTLARYPHVNSTWFGYGHTITNGSQSESMSSNNSFVGIILLPSVTLPKEFMEIVTDKKKVRLYSMIPLYKEEMNFKIKNGVESLVNKFVKFGVSDMIDVDRKNTCKKLSGLF
jgi:hypothetical protein